MTVKDIIAAMPSQFNADAPTAAVFLRVADSFLRDAVKTGHRVECQLGHLLVVEVDLETILAGKFLAEAR